MTKNEWHFFLEHIDNYRLYRITNIYNTPRILYIENLLEWLLQGKIVPYLSEAQHIQPNRIAFLITLPEDDEAYEPYEYEV